MQSRRPWAEVRSAYEKTANTTRRTYSSNAHALRDQRFILERFAEGRALADLLIERLGPDRRLRILDVGTGNAGVAIAVANVTNNEVWAVDHLWNADIPLLRQAARLPLRYAVASGESLPFPSEAFDAVLCLETIEHVREPEVLGAEIMRVLKPGGFCVITTPARLRFIFARDPHFGIPGLLLLPDAVQKWVTTNVARVIPSEEYDVVHIYWYVGSIARLFPMRSEFQAVGAPPTNPLARRVWSFLQRWFWQRCIVRKQTAA